MFAKVYTNPACKGEEKKAIEMIQRLYFYYSENPGQMPEQFVAIAKRDGVPTAACDFIAGMTDRYAVKVFTELFVPKAWSKLGDAF